MAIFAQNMNGIPVYPSPKNGERPYPGPPKWPFWDPVLGVFFCSFRPTTPRFCLLVFLFRYLLQPSLTPVVFFFFKSFNFESLLLSGTVEGPNTTTPRLKLNANKTETCTEDKY